MQANLARRLRPRTIDEIIGQRHLVGEGKIIRRMVETKLLSSMILYGPPGIGKTSIASAIAGTADMAFRTFNATSDKKTKLQEIAAEAQFSGQLVLLLDEIHRLDKPKQDFLLPLLENGEIILIGATTENPSFELNNALLSRVRTYVLRPLTPEAIVGVLQRALHNREHGLGEQDLQVGDEVLNALAQAADGDARRALNWLEQAADLAEITPDGAVLSIASVQEVVGGNLRRFDKGGDLFYEQISALHKSVRGTDPDAALYWLCRMLDGGCDPLYIARRVVRMATEDIGNADPRGLTLALNAWDTYERLGSPEGHLAIAQAVVYLACAPKSNAVYTAFKQAMIDAQQSGSLDVPLHLRNAPTTLMKALDYGKGYRYAHDEQNAYATGENYFPEALRGRRYYEPVARGLEIKIREKLAALRRHPAD